MKHWKHILLMPLIGCVLIVGLGYLESLIFLKADAGSSIQSLTTDSDSNIVAHQRDGTSLKIVLTKNGILEKGNAGLVTTTATDQLQITNLPIGLYKLEIGARSFTTDGGTDEAYITARLNDTNATSVSGVVIRAGTNQEGSITEASVTNGASVQHLISVTSISTFDLDIFISGANSSIRALYYRLEKLENAEQITTEWD